MIKRLQTNSSNAIYLYGMRHQDITNILNFCYTGAVDVSDWSDEEIQNFLDVAEKLGIKGEIIINFITLHTFHTCVFLKISRIDGRRVFIIQTKKAQPRRSNFKFARIYSME